MSVDILLYHKVKLSDGSEGIVRYIGGIMGKKGVFYGIDLTKGNAKNNGTFDGIQYFKTKKGTVTGKFVTANKIKTWSKTRHAKYTFKLNEKVFCKKTKCDGVIKYIGVPPWVKDNKTVHYGLELMERKGNCNGLFKNSAYFKTKKQYGIYVPYTQVSSIQKTNKAKPTKTNKIKTVSSPRANKKKKSSKKSSNNKKGKNKVKTSDKKVEKKQKHMKYDQYNIDIDEDADIDVDYDWNAPKSTEDGSDSDIDLEYDWNNNCIEEFDDDDAFDLDFLDMPHYGEKLEQARISRIVLLNIASNEYNEEDDSPVSQLSDMNPETYDGFAMFTPNTDNALAAIDDFKVAENGDINQSELMQIDNALQKYYQSLGCLKQFNDNGGKSIFIEYCEENNVSYNDIDKYFKSEIIQDYGYLDFDQKFPLKLSTDIEKDKSIDLHTKQQMRRGEIHTIIKYCYEHKTSPY